MSKKYLILMSILSKILFPSISLTEIRPHQMQLEILLSQPRVQDKEYEQLISKLNSGQRQYLDQLINHVKHSAEQITHYITCPAGVGKSLLIKAIFQSLLRFLLEIRILVQKNLMYFFVHKQVIFRVIPVSDDRISVLIVGAKTSIMI